MRRITISLAKPEAVAGQERPLAARVHQFSELNPEFAIAADSIESIQERIATRQIFLDLETNCQDAISHLEFLIELIELLEQAGSAPVLERTIQYPGHREQLKDAVSVTDLREVLEFEKSIRFRGTPERVEKFLQPLRAADWFARAGKVLLGDHGVLTDVANELPTENWLDVLLDAQNQLSVKLMKDFPFHFCRTLSPAMEEFNFSKLVREKISGVDYPFRDPEMMRLGLARLVGQACLEKYFEPQLSVSWGVRWSGWLLEGRIPCGWDGFGDDGKLVIF